MIETETYISSSKNRTLGEFLGAIPHYKFSNKHKKSFKDKQCLVPESLGLPVMGYLRWEEFDFTSWEYLMPVLEKVEKTYLNIHAYTLYDEGVWVFGFKAYSEDGDRYICEQEGDSKKEAMYLGLVDLVKNIEQHKKNVKVF
jgi:hypothetical protein